MKNQFYIILAVILLSACTSKFNFNTAYKFSTAKQSTKTEGIPSIEGIQSEIPLFASTKSKELLLAHPDFFDKIEIRLKELEFAENEAEKNPLPKILSKEYQKKKKGQLKRILRIR